MKSFLHRYRPTLLVKSLLLAALAGLIAIPGASIAPAAEDRPPNIILIVADDLGLGDLGAYGANHEVISTPHINRVYIEGRRYMNAHAPSAVCSPTRFAILTGAYPWRDNRVPRHLTAAEPLVIKDGEPTLPGLLKQRGYRTACIGKWHLGAQTQNPIDWNQPLKPGPNDTGFDWFYGVINSHNQAPFVWVENDRIVGRQPGERIEIKGNREEVSGIALKRRTDQISATLAQKAVKFIEDNKDQPFFLYYPACTVHTPLDPASFMKGKSSAGAYGDSVQEFDWQVGQVLRTLSKHKLHENTLLIVTSDNGAQTGPGKKFGHRSNGNARDGKATIYQGGIRVPFLARWPGKIPPATTSNQSISLVDLMATAAAAAGIELPPNAAPDSFNILSDLLGLQGSDTPARPPLICASKFQNHLSIHRGPWKLIAIREPVGDSPLAQYRKGRFGPDKPELYHLPNDPLEQQNLYEQRPRIVEELQGLLEETEAAGYSRPGYEAPEEKESDG